MRSPWPFIIGVALATLTAVVSVVLLSDGGNSADRPLATSCREVERKAGCERALELAESALKDELGDPTGTIAVQSIEEAVWDNESLGVSKSGLMHTKTSGPGFKIWLTSSARPRESWLFYTDEGTLAVSKSHMSYDTCEPLGC